MEHFLIAHDHKLRSCSGHGTMEKNRVGIDENQRILRGIVGLIHAGFLNGKQISHYRFH